MQILNPFSACMTKFLEKPLIFTQGMISMGPVKRDEGKLTSYWSMSVIVCTSASCMTQRASLPRRDSTPCYSHWLIR